MMCIGFIYVYCILYTIHILYYNTHELIQSLNILVLHYYYHTHSQLFFLYSFFSSSFVHLFGSRAKLLALKVFQRACATFGIAATARRRLRHHFQHSVSIRAPSIIFTIIYPSMYLCICVYIL